LIFDNPDPALLFTCLSYLLSIFREISSKKANEEFENDMEWIDESVFTKNNPEREK
jgi:hypothetical protein